MGTVPPQQLAIERRKPSLPASECVCESVACEYAVRNRRSYGLFHQAHVGAVTHDLQFAASPPPGKIWAVSATEGGMDDHVQMKLEAARQRARRNFSMGFNCGECVAEALLGELVPGVSPDTWKLSTGFGGGIGLYGDTCGALIGAVLAVGAIHGRSCLPEAEARQDVLAASRRQLYVNPGLYRIFNQLPNWFQERYGHTLCRELTAQWRNDWLCREHTLFCREVITDTAGFAANLMLLPEAEVRALRFGNVVEHIHAASTDTASDA